MNDNVRVLQCFDCKSLESIPDYQGNPDYDFLLARVLQAHNHPDGVPHKGNIFTIEESAWKNPTTREEVAKRIWEESGHTGFDPEAYALRDTYQEDAGHCFRLHFPIGTPDRCIDYRTDRKRLTPGTAWERKKAGLPKYHSVKDVYLCDFCPIHSMVMVAKRGQAGLYK